MSVYGFEATGFHGELVKVEVDIKRGIPALDIVGLPDGAVKEARDRIRAAIGNAGFEFPMERLLINLAPASLKKEGSAFDLSMALAILLESGQVAEPGFPILAMGELELSGRIRPVRAVLPAVANAIKMGINIFLVAPENQREAAALGGSGVIVIEKLAQLSEIVMDMRNRFLELKDGCPAGTPSCRTATLDDGPGSDSGPDMSDLRGQPELRRALEIAAAGAHHMLILGPPGVGKTMAARRLSTIMPELGEEDSITLTRLYSLANLLKNDSGLIRKPPFRSPHHGASFEGMIGGGRQKSPGEISLAHCGVLFLDEAPEFRIDVLQALREPLEEGYVSIARADSSRRFPSSFIMIMACNPCPCGRLGKKNDVCICSTEQIRRYWRKISGPLMDRIDLRVYVKSSEQKKLLDGPAESSRNILERVRMARRRQEKRQGSGLMKLNAWLGPSQIDKFCHLDSELLDFFTDSSQKMELSARGSHGVLKTARTIADLDDSEIIKKEYLIEAFAFRSFVEEQIWKMF